MRHFCSCVKYLVEHFLCVREKTVFYVRMTVNLMPFVCYEYVQMHVLILCTPTLCDMLLCHVCSHPPYAWDSHRVVVVVGVFQDLILVFWGISYDFCEVLILLFDLIFVFLLPFSSHIVLETLFRECRPPFHFSSQKHHAFFFSVHAHIQANTLRNLLSPTCIIPTLSHP